MLPSEGDKEMHIKFINIVNNLKSPRKFYSNEEVVSKLLRTLQRSLSPFMRSNSKDLKNGGFGWKKPPLLFNPSAGRKTTNL